MGVRFHIHSLENQGRKSRGHFRILLTTCRAICHHSILGSPDIQFDFLQVWEVLDMSVTFIVVMVSWAFAYYALVKLLESLYMAEFIPVI